MKLRLSIVSLNLIGIKANGRGMGPGPCDRRGVKTGADGNCVDINECETGEANCPSDHVCFNLDASTSSGYFGCEPAWLDTTSSSTTETTAATQTETMSQGKTTAQVETITQDS